MPVATRAQFVLVLTCTVFQVHSAPWGHRQEHCGEIGSNRLKKDHGQCTLAKIFRRYLATSVLQASCKRAAWDCSTEVHCSRKFQRVSR